jgi:hypothetical protein
MPVRQGEVWWRLIPGFPGYQVSSDGNVWSDRVGWALRKDPHWRTGHPRVVLYAGGERTRFYVHRLVAMAFVHNPAPSEKGFVLHLNGKSDDCRAENLAWGTRVENAAHARSHGTVATGVRNGRGRIADEDVIRLRECPNFQTLDLLSRELGISYEYAKRIHRYAAREDVPDPYTVPEQVG